MTGQDSFHTDFQVFGRKEPVDTTRMRFSSLIVKNYISTACLSKQKKKKKLLFLHFSLILLHLTASPNLIQQLDSRKAHSHSPAGQFQEEQESKPWLLFKAYICHFK